MTFVLKLRFDATGDALSGRLENLVTARRVQFSSARELLDAIAHELDAGAASPATEQA